MSLKTAISALGPSRSFDLPFVAFGSDALAVPASFRDG